MKVALLLCCCSFVISRNIITAENSIVTFVTVPDEGDLLKQAYMDCMVETRVLPVYVKKFKAGSWATHPNLKQWALCVLIKIGLMSTEGVYHYDVAMARIHNHDKAEVDKLLDHCLSKKYKPPQEIAWNYLKCHHKIDKNNNFPTLGITHSF